LAQAANSRSPVALPPERRRAGASQKTRHFLAKETIWFYLCSYRATKENAALSDCPEAASPAAPCDHSTEARAARLAKFEREKLIIEYLNRGVSVPEIAAHVGVSEKRMRAVIREILARRMPAPPTEFVAIQVSRLNEALLVAYSAMSGTNLKAIDRVVKIVRELDRYHGFVAAERRLSDASRLEAPAQRPLAFGAALFCRPEIAPQDLEEIESAPGNDAPSPALREKVAGVSPLVGGKRALTPALSREWEREREAAPQAASRLVTPPYGPLALDAPLDDRPENPPQRLEKIESTPEIGLPAEASNAQDAAPERWEAFAPRRAAAAQGPRACDAPPTDRPTIPPQGIEKIEFRPGPGWAAEAGPAPGGASFVSPTFLTPFGVKRRNVRATPNGVAAC
jgi:hypothetical protein